MGQSLPEEMEFVHHLDEKTWHDFVYSNQNANIFHTPEMFQVFKLAHNHQPQLSAIVDQDKNILALLPTVQVTMFNGLMKRLTTRSISYGSVMSTTDPVGKQALLSLLKVYSEQAGRISLFTELRNLLDLSMFQQEFSKAGFIYEDHLNYLIDLNNSPERILQNIGSRTRQHIRRGLRKGVVVVESISDRDQLGTWYKIIQMTYKGARIPLADISLFEAAFDILYPRKMIKFLLARIGSEYVAASAEMLFKDVIYGWYGGMNREYSKYTPNELLMWHILEWGASNGFKIYDFGGAGKPGEEFGVRDFKAKFGGQLVCYGRYTKVHQPNLLKWSERGYKLFQKLLGYF
jgi:lipid II:glycine glycyltransferase (peptidoglycan interpeptide bridge formation enzyme)